MFVPTGGLGQDVAGHRYSALPVALLLMWATARFRGPSLLAQNSESPTIHRISRARDRATLIRPVPCWSARKPISPARLLLVTEKITTSASRPCTASTVLIWTEI